MTKTAASRLPRPRAVAAAVALSLAAGIAGAAPLSLNDAVDLAQRDAPTLAVVAARIDAARQAAMPAAELPDPKLSVGIENLPVSGMDRWSLTRDGMTMQRIGLMQEVPSRDKREARLALAQARVARAEAERRVAASLVRRETALAWIRRHTLERQIEQLKALGDENRLLETTVRAQIAGGTGMAADAVMPRQEAAMLDERHDELSAERAMALAALRRWIGDAAGEPLLGDVPAWPLEAAHLQGRLHDHPELSAFDAMAGMADAELREAQAMKTPDWGVELAYQRRGREFGDMVSVMFTVELPLFTARRQDPQIAAKAAERRAVDADREASLREHQAALAGDLAQLQRLQRAAERQRREFLPLAQQRIDLLTAGYRAGRNALADVVAARRERVGLLLKTIAIEGERDAMAARLHFTYDTEPQGGRP